jgi:molecular chaperone DnaK
MGMAVGVDLGTSTSTIACYDGLWRRLPTSDNRHAIPSVVTYLDGGGTVIGPGARRRGGADAGVTIQAVKRFLGRGYGEVTDLSTSVAGVVTPAWGDTVRFRVSGGPVTPEEVSARLLRALADDLGRRLGEPVGEVVIAVPASFGDAARRATREAGRLAGLDVVRLVNEPAAAALAYSVHRTGQETVMVFDLGGGTLDVAIVEVGFGIVEVRAAAGDGQLGGGDVDRVIAEHLADEMVHGTGVDPRHDRPTWHRLVEAAERAKVRLSAASKTRVSVPLEAAAGARRFSATLTRDALEALTADLVRRCRHTAQRALTDAGVAAEDLDEVLIVGRAARMPAVRAMLRSLTGGRLPRTSMDMDDIVAAGASIQAAALRGAVCDALVWDVTTVDLTARTGHDRGTAIVRRNTATPVTRTIAVPPGRRDVAVVEEDDAGSRVLGRVELGRDDGLPRERSVMFHVDADGILSASVVDPATGAERSLPIVTADGPTDGASADAGRGEELLVLGRSEW